MASAEPVEMMPDDEMLEEDQQEMMPEARRPIPVTAVTIGFGEVATNIEDYLPHFSTFNTINSGTKSDTLGTSEWGIWATDHDGAFLFAVEMDRTATNFAQYNTGVKLWGNKSGSRPSSIHTGVLTWDGNILGEDKDDNRFTGDIRLTVDTSRRLLGSHDVLDIRIDGLSGSGSNQPTGTIEYEDLPIISAGRFTRFDQLGAAELVAIEGNFFGNRHQAVGGKITDLNENIKTSIFGARRTR